MAFEWQWSAILLPAVPNLVRYGYRPVLGGGVRQSWNTLGFFGLLELSGGQYVVSRTQTMPHVDLGTGPILRAFGVGDFDPVVEGRVAVALLYYPHRWVPLTSMQVWGLIDV
jgi:hypothetical protein